MSGLQHESVTEDIVGAAMAVLNTMTPGLVEKIYERALVIALEKRGRQVSVQKEFDVFYEGQKVGTLRPDLIIDDIGIVETKVADAFHDAHIAQLLGYLAITDRNVGLLLNFKHPRLKWKWIVR